jgi:mannose-6-phosphate isomerase-like protein (cupin superfamily)
MQQNIYQPGFYGNLKPLEIRERILVEGFDPVQINDPPAYIYPPHHHPETKLLAFLSGGMDVLVANQTYHCGIGDRLLIPGNVEHSAHVTENGCVYFWSEKLA